MGTWGPGLFSDDIACEVREAYRRLVGEGLSGPEATAALLRDWHAQLADPDLAPVFWLALASTQWRVGRLEERVKDQAIEVIDSGLDIHRWQENPRLLTKRRAVLAKLRQQLLSEQPREKRVAKAFQDSSPWEAGEVIAYRLGSGQLTLFRIIGFHTDDGGTSPIFEPLDWTGERLPDELVVRRLGLRPTLRSPPALSQNQFMIGRGRERDLPRDRVVRTGLKLKPSQAVGGYSVFTWKYLDRFLAALYGLA